MRAELRRSDEHHEIARAAEAWLDGGAIDETTAAAIRARHPDDRRRTRPAFRALFFLLTVLAGLGFWGFAAAFVSVPLSGSTPHAVVLALLAAAAAVGAQVAIGPLRLWRFGVEEGLAALALGFGIGALGLALDAADAPEEVVLVLLGSALAAGATIVAFRWAMPLAGLAAVAGALIAVRQLPAPRLAWTLAAAALAVVAHRIARSDAAPVAAVGHRRRAEEARAAGLFALYWAVHPTVATARFFDSEPLVGGASALAWASIVVLPVGLLALGIVRRGRVDLALGALLALATGASAIDALDLEPAWAVLLVSAAALGGIAFAVRAQLGAAPGRTLGGFTDRELLAASESASWLELGATLAALAPAPRPIEPDRALQGRGGEFGGGGASSEF